MKRSPNCIFWGLLKDGLVYSSSVPTVLTSKTEFTKIPLITDEALNSIAVISLQRLFGLQQPLCPAEVTVLESSWPGAALIPVPWVTLHFICLF